MKKSTKIILGTTIPAVALAAIIPTIVVLTKKQPESVEEFELDLSQTDKHAYSYIERKFDADGYCYISDIKLVKGDISNLSAKVKNVKNFDSDKYDATIIPLQNNYFMVRVHFESNYMVGIQAPTFDVEIYDNAGHSVTISGCSAAFSEDSVTIRQGSLETEQKFYTKNTSNSYSLFLKGTLKGNMLTPSGSTSISDWSTFIFKCEPLTPVTGMTIETSMVQVGIAPHILLEMTNCPTELSSLPIKLTLTNSQLPNWSWDTNLTLTIEKTTDDTKLYEYVCDEDTSTASISSVHTFDENLTIPKQVTIDSKTYTIESIEKYAFFGYLNLKSITLPDTLKTIQQDAFLDCIELNNVTIPALVTSIDPFAFEYCINLNNFIVEDENETYTSKINGVPSNCLITKDGTKLIAGLSLESIPDSITTLGKDCFYSSQNLKDVTIPSNITTIEEEVFCNSSITNLVVDASSSVTTIPSCLCMDCTSLETFTFNYNITNIDTRALSGCTSLKSFNTRNVSRFGNWVFSGCKSLETLKIGDSLSHLGNDTFNGCVGLKNITVDTSNNWFTSRDVYEKECGAILSYNKQILYKASSSFTGLFEGITQISKRAFEGISDIKSISIPSSLTTIGVSAFLDCAGLESIDFGTNPSLTTIDESAFKNCTGLKEVVIPKSCTEFKTNCFANCTTLTKVSFENDSPLTTLGNSVFVGCVALESVTLPSKLTSIPEECFGECYKLKTVTIPDTVTTIGQLAFDWCITLNSIQIPKAVKTIGSFAFADCLSLKNISFTNDSVLTTIDIGCFKGCTSLDNMSIPSGVTALGTNVFENCYNLKTITLPDGFKSLGRSCFCKCTSLVTIALPDTIETLGDSCFEACFALKSINIPTSLTTIGSYAFYECSQLASITIPSTVSTIGLYAFTYCDQLSSATFANTTGWKYVFDGTDVAISSDVAANATILKEGYAITTLL